MSYQITYTPRAVRKAQIASYRTLAQDGTVDNFSTILGIVSLLAFALALSF